MASWMCSLCGNSGTDLGSFVKLTAQQKAHLKCYRDELAEEVLVKHAHDEAEAKADRERAEADRRIAVEEAALAGLLALRAKGKDLWTRDDRIKLAAAKLICVHCGVPIGKQAPERPSGSEQKHCHKCYMAREYGEAAMAQTAAKSQASLEAASAVLAGEKPAEAKPVQAAPTPEVKKPEVKDRFNLIEME